MTSESVLSLACSEDGVFVEPVYTRFANLLLLTFPAFCTLSFASRTRWASHDICSCSSSALRFAIFWSSYGATEVRVAPAAAGRSRISGSEPDLHGLAASPGPPHPQARAPPPHTPRHMGAADDDGPVKLPFARRSACFHRSCSRS